MPTMTTEQRRAFLSSGTRTGHLATVSANGAPHVAPIWFVLDGDDVLFTTSAATVKGRNLQRDPRAALSVDDPAPMYSFVHVRGTVALSDDLEEMYRWALPISARYMGRERAEEYARRNAVEGELLVRLRPERIVAEADIAS